MRYYPYRHVYGMSEGRLRLIYTPEALCPVTGDYCPTMFGLLHDRYGMQSIPACPAMPEQEDIALPSVLMPSNMLLSESLCAYRWTARLRDLRPYPGEDLDYNTFVSSFKPF